MLQLVDDLTEFVDLKVGFLQLCLQGVDLVALLQDDCRTLRTRSCHVHVAVVVVAVAVVAGV